jgi:hypothetical protein
MNKKTALAVLILLSLATAGCQKVGSTTQTIPVPAALGDFVAVTPGDGQLQAVLWFKQPDQTIVAVRVHLGPGTNRYTRN